MRNIIPGFLTCLLLFCTHELFAQVPIDIGVKAGISIPNLTSGSSDNPINSGWKSRVGPDFAVHAEFHLSKRFSIQPQLEYSAQGGKKDGDQGFTTPPAYAAQFPPGQVPQYLYASYNSEAKFNYLMLPIFAKYHFPLSKSWGLYVGVGPFVSLVLSAKNVTTGSSNVYLDAGHTQPLTPAPQSFDHTEDIKRDLHSANAGVAGHVGVAYNFGKSNVFVEGGGNYGLVKIQKDKTNGDNNTGAASVVLGYAFRIH